jgi:CheY-like chemotaxis protein
MELTRVVIVDESQLGREALEAVLSAHVEQVLSAKSAAEGIALASEARSEAKPSEDRTVASM